MRHRTVQTLFLLLLYGNTFPSKSLFHIILFYSPAVFLNVLGDHLWYVKKHHYYSD